MTTQSIYHDALLAVVAMLPLMVTPNIRNNRVINVPNPSWCIFLIAFAVWCMANVPIYLGTWTDRGAYAGSFLEIVRNGYTFKGLEGETLFGLYTWVVSWFSKDYHVWFYVTALIYLTNYFVAARRMTKEYAFVLFLSMVCCFQFFAYGNNTIRAGFAGSFVILGLTFCNRLPVMVACFFFALFCHKSMLAPIAALSLSYAFRKKSQIFLWVWLCCICISYFSGSFFEGFFSQFVDGRRNSYFTAQNVDPTFYRVGFRWDFLFYSSLPVALGYYYQKVLGFKSEFYGWVYGAYLVANSFWLLIIRTLFTDRFAYLSWFMYPILLFYPLLSKQLFPSVQQQRLFIVLLLCGQFAFTYYMFLAYNGFNPFR